MNRTGIVIGGKHAGQTHSTDGEYLKLPIKQLVSPHFTEEQFVSMEIMENTYAIYQFVSMHWRHTDPRYSDRNFGFWVPVEEKYPQPFILDMLIESYVNANR